MECLYLSFTQTTSLFIYLLQHDGGSEGLQCFLDLLGLLLRHVFLDHLGYALHKFFGLLY